VQKDLLATTCQPCPSGVGRPGAIGVEECDSNCTWPLAPHDGECRSCGPHEVPVHGGCQRCPRAHLVINNTCIPCEDAYPSSDKIGCDCDALGLVLSPSPRCVNCSLYGARVQDGYCKPCEVGTVPATRASCRACPTGSFADKPGLPTCTKCRPACPPNTILEIPCSPLHDQQCIGCTWLGLNACFLCDRVSCSLSAASPGVSVCLCF